MKLPRDLDSQTLVRALGVLVYERTRQVGSHIRVTTQMNGEHHEVIPNHRPLKVGTLQSILSSVARHHGISVGELLEKIGL